MKENFCRSYEVREETTLDKIISFQKDKSTELGIPQITDEMKIKLMKVLNKCVDCQQRGIYYNYEDDILAILSNAKPSKGKSLTLSNKKSRIN